MERGLIKYTADTIYGASRYPFGGLKPHVVYGTFHQNQNGELQRLFFQELLLQNFRRTIWQLVFPDQTAGLIKKIPIQEDGTNEYHVRFYKDGIIDCELEVSRRNSMHWVGPRRNGLDALNSFLENSMLIQCEQTKDRIRNLFGNKPYSNSCIRKS